MKDVVGFLGLAPLPYIGNYGWKVFGTEEPSIRLRDKYEGAKQAALKFLEEPNKEGVDESPRMLH